MKPNEDDIVVSGISGRFPNSDNIEEFWCNLISGNELCSADDRRWPVGFMGTPPISGKMKEISKIDAEFFKMCAKEAEFLDPQYRVLHEVVYEAIYDAGLIPETLRGSKTAVLVGECVKEVNHDFGRDLLERDKDRALVENDCGFLALTFGFKSAAFKIDTACASSFSCFNEGINMIKARHCENLVIGGVSLNLTP
ncbi:fatty acid synthase-like protein, partial [Dinothrombium tinctorium]